MSRRPRLNHTPGFKRSSSEFRNARARARESPNGSPIDFRLPCEVSAPSHARPLVAFAFAIDRCFRIPLVAFIPMPTVAFAIVLHPDAYRGLRHRAANRLDHVTLTANLAPQHRMGGLRMSMSRKEFKTVRMPASRQ